MFAMHTLRLRCSRGVPSITMLEWGHKSSPCSNQDGPFHHWLLCHNSSGPVPLDKISAGLSSEATWCQRKFDVISWISDTLLATYVFHLVGMSCKQVKTSIESVHRWTLSMGVHKIGNTFLISLASNCAPQTQALEWILVSQVTLLILSTGVANVVHHLHCLNVYIHKLQMFFLIHRKNHESVC
jgi:hypothetical protein